MHNFDLRAVTIRDGRFEYNEEKEMMAPKLVIVMVGLPARGKSYISKKLARYLNWLQYETRVFNAGQTRRSDQTQNGHVNEHSLSQSASFFDPDDVEAVTRREEIALLTLDDLLRWLQQEKSSVGILDATNSTIQRRQTVMDRIQGNSGANVECLFLESCCYDAELLEKNIQLKLSGPDYKHKEAESSLADFRQRIKLYEKRYVPLGSSEAEKELPYLQLIDVGRRIIANCINGFLSSQAAEYLMNFRLHERQIWITRNGESLDDVEGKIGRSSPLSPKGVKFAYVLTNFIEEQRRLWEIKKLQSTGDEKFLGNKGSDEPHQSPNNAEFHVWTSIMAQAIETSQFFNSPKFKTRHFRMLNDLHAGMMEGLTFAEISHLHSNEMEMRQQNPVYYRWPGSGGESYADVIHRLRPVIMELERMKDHIVLITHRAVARVLLAYFQELDWDEITEVEVPPGRVFCVEPRPYGVNVQTYQYDEQTEQFLQLHQK